MRHINDYILEYKQRVKTSFDYDKIKQAIQNCKPKFSGNNVSLPILWTPEIYFIYGKEAWSAGKPNDEFFKGRHYKEISLGSSSVVLVCFYAKKRLFKEDDIDGFIDWILPAKINDDDTNCDDVEKYLLSKANFTSPAQGIFPETKRIEFKTYEELEKILKELESVVNKHNTKCDNDEPTYLYFSKDEAEHNSEFKRQRYEIISTEEQIVELNKQLKEVESAEKSTDTDLSELKSKIETQINKLKQLKTENQK